MRGKWFGALLRRRLLIVLLIFLQLGVFIWLVVGGSHASRVINGCLTAVSFFVAMHIIAKRDKGAYKLTWVFQILLFPIFGGLFYLLFKYQISGKRFGDCAQEIGDRTRKLFLLPGDRFADARERAPAHLPQIRYLQDFAGFPVYTHTATQYLSPGEKKFEALLAQLRLAKRYIFLEYFIVHEGIMWDSILAILKEKAAQGVLVRLLYDDVGCLLLLPKDYPALLAQWGIACAAFNPFTPLLTVTQNNRDHRKIAVIDGEAAFTGGINLADEYINAVERFGHWKDAAILVRGEAAWSFTLMFLEMWALCTGQEEDCAAYYPWGETPCAIETDGLVQPYADSPTDRENVGEHVYLQMLANAKDYVYICTPYLVVDDSMLSALTLAAKSGVDVRIITPHRWDKRLVHMTTRSYYRELVAAGVRVYEYTKGFMHAKTFVSDDETATVGTTNLDFRSLYLHFECGVWLHRSSAVLQVKEDFLRTLPICREITPQDCEAGFCKRFAQEVLRLFAPLM